MQHFSFLFVTTVVLAVCAFDVWLQFLPGYSYGHLLSRAEHFDSAVRQAGIGSVLDESENPKLLIVMVEGWGAFNNPDLADLVLEPLYTTEINEKFVQARGVTPYFGSTTAAEVRELCGKWGDFPEYAEAPAPSCLPAIWRDRGYKTVAYHGFSEDMFDRQQWYPNIGFSKSHFLQQLWTRDLPVCRGVFSGMCDADVAKRVSDELSNASGPIFVYWLTLNSHLPIHPSVPEKNFACLDGKNVFDNYDVCRIANLWTDVFSEVAAMLKAPGNATVTAVVIGDHPPPYWGRKEKRYFENGKVPWIALRPRTSMQMKKLPD